MILIDILIWRLWCHSVCLVGWVCSVSQAEIEAMLGCWYSSVEDCLAHWRYNQDHRPHQTTPGSRTPPGPAKLPGWVKVDTGRQRPTFFSWKNPRKREDRKIWERQLRSSINWDQFGGKSLTDLLLTYNSIVWVRPDLGLVLPGNSHPSAGFVYLSRGVSACLQCSRQSTVYFNLIRITSVHFDLEIIFSRNICSQEAKTWFYV